MRVISQDGQCDLPYDAMVIKVEYKNKIVARAWMSVLYIAEYSTPQKAMKAMEMLRNKYAEYRITHDKPLAQLNVWGESYICAVPKVFQFPQDDEIEEDEKND